MLIDTHGHVNFNAFREDSNAVLRRALENNTWVIMPGTQYSTSRRAVETAEGFERGVYAAVGIHPIHLEKRRVDVMEVQSESSGEQPWMLFTTNGEQFDYKAFKALAQSKKVVAVGEIGLDYYYEPKGRAKRELYRNHQKEVLQQQLDLAKECDLPAILHCRVAHDDLLEFLAAYCKLQHTPLRGVIHCFTGNTEQAKQFMELGFFIGFNGLIFKNVPALPSPQEVISSIPLDRIVLETDSPYLVPPSARRSLGEGGQSIERNEPVFVKYVAEEIARIKHTTLEEIAEVTTASARELFSI